MTNAITAIREALANFKQTPYGLAGTFDASEQLQEVCNPAAITELLSKLDIHEQAIKDEREACAKAVDGYPECALAIRARAAISGQGGAG
jgi:hypothetical protein